MEGAKSFLSKSVSFRESALFGLHFAKLRLSFPVSVALSRAQTCAGQALDLPVKPFCLMPLACFLMVKAD